MTSHVVRLSRLALACIAACLIAACSSTSAPTGSDVRASGDTVPGGVAGLSVSAIAANVGGGDGNLRWEQVTSRGESTLAVRSDGSLWGWGQGVLDYESGYSTEPVRVGRDSDWVRASTNGGPSGTNAAIKADGSLWVWGTNFLGMLGVDVPEWFVWEPIGGYTSVWSLAYYAPRSLGGNDWSDVSVGANHVLAVKQDGSLWAWGYRGGAALGDGVDAVGDSTEGPNRRQLPLRIGTDTDWVAVQAGCLNSLGLKADGSLWRWGYWNGRTILLPERVGAATDRWTAAFSAYEHALAIREDGSLWTFGNNDYGRMGAGTPAGSDAPILVDAGPWKAVAAGDTHSLAVKSDGTLWAWGDNGYGMLGNGTLIAASTPVRIGSASDWLLVGAGRSFSCALKSKNPDGKLWLWGANDYGQLGNRLAAESASPNPVDTGRTAFVKAVAGSVNTFGLCADGTLWGWGANGYGELGDGTNLPRQLPAVVSSAMPSWLDIAAGDAHTLGIRSDGTLYSWGGNFYGQLGTGGTTDRALPGPVIAGNWKAVFAGTTVSFAIRADGSLWAWGADIYNNLGIGNAFPPGTSVIPEMTIATPRRVGSDVGWKQVAPSQVQAAAVRDDGSLWSWGTGAFGALGHGVTDTGVPVRVGSDNDWAFVTTSGYHMAALKRDGSLWAWGNNAAGQLGDGTYVGRDAPVRIGSALWRSVAVIANKTVAVRDDGTLWGWGGVVPRIPGAVIDGGCVPVRIGNSARWRSVASGDQGGHWVAMQDDGGIHTWGTNYCGQLGNLVAWTPFPVWIP